MSKYFQSKEGFQVVNGLVKSVSSDGKEIVVSAKQWDRESKKESEIDVKVTSQVPVNMKEGYRITACGYAHGKNTLAADSITGASGAYETAEVAVISGKISRAEYRSEEGKMKADGVTPKNPHFDITIRAKNKDAEGKDVWKSHVIQIYNSKFRPDAIEQMQKRFSKFTEKNEQGYTVMNADIQATVITQPGNDFEGKPWTGNDGVERRTTYSYHMGVRSLDMEVLPKEKTQEKTTQASKDEAKEATEEKAQEAPSSEGSGFSAPTEEEFEENT